MTRAATATLEKSPLDEFKAHCFWRFNAKKKDANIVKAVASGGEFVDFVAFGLGGWAQGILEDVFRTIWR